MSEADRARYQGLSLLEFIPALSPQFASPWHLREWCAAIEACLEGGVRALVAVPIRHFKTWTTLHGIAWLLVQKPDLRIIFMCADHTRAMDLGKDLRRLCVAAGIGPVRGDNTIVDWGNDQGGGVYMMSAEQSGLGRDCDVLIFDDPITEQTADNKAMRDAIDMAIAHYTARAGRLGLRGSVLGVMSRWHPDDPMGRRMARRAVDWQVVQHPAIEDLDGENERAFAPEVMDLEEVKRRRAELYEADPSERLFFAQFQNDPRAAAENGFGHPARYAGFPPWIGWKAFMGIDLAYSKEKHSDWFAVVCGRRYGANLFLTQVTRLKVDFQSLEVVIRTAWDTHGKCPVFTYASGPERAGIVYFHSRGIPVQYMHTSGHKWTRAQRTKDMWNAGRILLPDDAKYEGFIQRVKLFTGNEDAGDDDEVDALVSACDGGFFGAGGTPRACGGKRRL